MTLEKLIAELIEAREQMPADTHVVYAHRPSDLLQIVGVVIRTLEDGSGRLYLTGFNPANKEI